MKTILASHLKTVMVWLLFSGAIVLYPAATAIMEPATVPDWVQRHNGAMDADDRGQTAAVDASGNVVIAGTSDASVASNTGSDWLIIKYSNSGAPSWTNLYSQTATSVDGVNAVAVDGSGNVIVTGYSTDGESSFHVTIKYSEHGVPLWTNRTDLDFGALIWGSQGGSINAVAVNADGGVFVTAGTGTVAYSGAGVPLWTNLFPAAQTTSVAVTGAGDLVVAGRDRDYEDCVTVKYSQMGVPLWTNRFSVCGYGRGYSVAVDTNGNAFVTGSTDCSGSLILAYSSAGRALWTNYYNGPAFGDNASSTAGLAVGANGNIFVASSSEGTGSSEFVTVAYSNTGLPLWTNRYHGPGIGKDVATGIALDRSGSVYVTGSSVGSAGHHEYTTLKYSGDGVPLWTNRFSGPADSRATSVAVDTRGQTFVTGYSWSGSSYDLVTLSASTDGGVLWTNRYNRTLEADDQPLAVAVDASGNLFVTGSSSGGGVSDYLTLAFSGSGQALWTNRHSAPGNSIDVAASMVIDNGGNAIVTGKSGLKSSSDPWASFDYETIKYSAAGLPLWTNRYDGPGQHNDEPAAVGVDAGGNVFVTGSSVGVQGSHAYATIKYSSLGVPLWTNRYSGTATMDTRAVALAVDTSGSVIVTGESSTATGSQDYLTIKYSATGTAIWTNRYNGPASSSDFARSVAVDGNGTVFVTGSSLGNGRSSDWATIAYSSAGMALWTNRYNGPANGHDSPSGMAVDKQGNVIVTGSAYIGANSADILTIKYSGTGVPLWTNRYDGPSKGWDGALAVALDDDDNVVITGSSTATNGWPYTDQVALKYSAAGMSLWTNRYSGTVIGSERATALVVDRSGGVVVVGQSWNGTSFDYVTIRYSSDGVPLLAITRTASNQVTVSWPSPSRGFRLQQTAGGIGSSDWSDVASTPTDDGRTRAVIVEPPADTRFYRLVRP